jgi:hypothetical protein
MNLLIVFHIVLQNSENVGQEEDSEVVGQDDSRVWGGRRMRTQMVSGRSNMRTWRVRGRSTTRTWRVQGRSTTVASRMMKERTVIGLL